MSKILVIGVGGAGRETVKHMKDIGIPEAEYITFGGFEDCDERKDIPHYNLIHMNGHCGISPTHRPSVFKHLARMWKMIYGRFWNIILTIQIYQKKRVLI